MRSVIICSLALVAVLAVPRHKRQADYEVQGGEIHVKNERGEVHGGVVRDSNGNEIQVVAAEDRQGNGGIQIEGQGPAFRQKRGADEKDDEIIDISVSKEHKA
ncbi:unnamed protein product [Bursaphelenchus xylophilus]|uniref:(pine wood nematode) hypothetical protein n=1 Tax=Bursaphelenchus xylophilus TaxID=6326 RepID=A0A1I7SIY9_BURXY|nr:unnamed protein product [Bursaphelenchus xylophilus]CAG9100791.1 unnamed protein product [Bursaphelenchus xylophilus]